MIATMSPAKKERIYRVAMIVLTIAIALASTVYSLSVGIYEVFPFILQLHDTFQNNVLISVGSKCGKVYISEDIFEGAQNFFNGGGSVLRADMSYFSPGPMRQMHYPEDKIIHVNVTEQASKIQEELEHISNSAFLPNDVSEALKKLKKSVDDVYSGMIEFLDDKFRNQRIRLISAVGDNMTLGGLWNDFSSKYITLDAPIEQLRQAIRRSLDDERARP